MTNDAETTATNAERTAGNSPGYCLQWSRQRAAIGSRYGDAATEWKHTIDRYPGNRTIPRGAMAYWTGGASGYGHIAPSVGVGNIRSTDAGGAGKVATVDLGWIERNWGLTYVGWAWDVNGVTIPHEEDDMGDINLSQAISKWAPDGTTGDGKTTLGKTFNQARGYAEDAYERLGQVQADLAAIKKALGIK